MERKYIIYQHTTPSGKVYIGQTCLNTNVRWANGSGYKTCKLFYYSIKKYGWDNIEHKILHKDLSKEQADILEKMYIQFFKIKHISLNITDGGEGMTGFHHTEEARIKISEAHKGKPRKPFSEEHRRKISEALKGKGKGRHRTEESKQKISEALKGKIVSDEHRRKLSEVHKGRLFADEHRRKISESLKGH